MGNERPLLCCRIQRRCDVVDEPVRSNDWLLRFSQGAAYADAAPIRKWGRPRASKKRISRAKLDAVRSLIGSAHSIYIRSDNLQVMDLHITLPCDCGRTPVGGAQRTGDRRVLENHQATLSKSNWSARAGA